MTLPAQRQTSGVGKNQMKLSSCIIVLAVLCALLPGQAAADPAEDGLIETDWRKQDGIGTERAPATFAAAIANTLERGELLVRDLQASGVPLAEAAAWEALRDEWRERSAAGAPDDPAWEDLWRRVHQARRKIAFSNPLVRFGPAALRQAGPEHLQPPAHPVLRELCPAGRRGLRPRRARAVAEGPPPRSPARCPWGASSTRRSPTTAAGSSSPTATPKPRLRTASRNLDRFYHLYEMAADGSGLRQLTDGPYDDFSPRYLPDGRIMFISTRRGGFHRCGQGPVPDLHAGHRQGRRLEPAAGLLPRNPRVGPRGRQRRARPLHPLGLRGSQRGLLRAALVDAARRHATCGSTTATTRSTRSASGRRGRCRARAA